MKEPELLEEKDQKIIEELEGLCREYGGLPFSYSSILIRNLSASSSKPYHSPTFVKGTEVDCMLDYDKWKSVLKEAKKIMEKSEGSVGFRVRDKVIVGKRGPRGLEASVIRLDNGEFVSQFHDEESDLLEYPLRIIDMIDIEKWVKSELDKMEDGACRVIFSPIYRYLYNRGTTRVSGWESRLLVDCERTGPFDDDFFDFADRSLKRGRQIRDEYVEKIESLERGRVSKKSYIF